MGEVERMIPFGVIPDGTKWCVAGGYAACPALAKDIDVWVYGIEPLRLESVQAAHQLRLKEQFGYAFVPSSERIETSSYSQDLITILKVGDLFHGSKPHHIIVTDAESVASILDGFDISAHAVAIRPDGTVETHPLFTPPHEKPIVLRDQRNTPARLVRICGRFGHPLPPAPLDYDKDRDLDEDDDIPF